MAIRWYVCQVTGSGSSPEDPFRPALDILVDVRWKAVDGRADPQSASGWMLVQADVTDAEHATVAADSRCRYLPFEAPDGTPLSIDAPISEMDAGKRSAMQDALENRDVPLDGLTLTSTVRQVLRRIILRLAGMRQILQGDDWTEGLDTLVSDAPSAKRQRIASKLQARGFDTSVIQGTDTIREALAKLRRQDVPANRTNLD